MDEGRRVRGERRERWKVVVGWRGKGGVSSFSLQLHHHSCLLLRCHFSCSLHHPHPSSLVIAILHPPLLSLLLLLSSLYFFLLCVVLPSSLSFLHHLSPLFCSLPPSPSFMPFLFPS